MNTATIKVNLFMFIYFCFLQEVVKTYITYHRLISYSLYLIGMLRPFSFLQTFSEHLNCYIKKEAIKLLLEHRGTSGDL